MRRISEHGTLAFLLAFLFLSAIFAFQYAWRTKTPRQLLVGQMRDGQQAFSLQVPSGDHYHLVVGIPRAANIQHSRVHGVLSITSGSNQVLRIAFDSANSTTGNWLASNNLDAFIISLPLKDPAINIDKQLSRGGQITVRLESEGADASGASLWLCYLERWLHRKLHSQPDALTAQHARRQLIPR